MNYYQALHTRKKVTQIPPGMRLADAKKRIGEITLLLCGGRLGNGERIMLVHDRDDLRDIVELFRKEGCE